MKKIEYIARNGSQISKKNAQKYGDRLQELRESYGYITPNMVLNDAKEVVSPLHDYFEWDNKTAASKYRIRQASELIRSIKVIIINNGKKEEIREYYSINNDSDGEIEEPKIYVSLKTIKEDKEKRNEVISYALRELKGWKERYKIYKELSPMIEYIEEFEPITVEMIK